MSYSVTTLKSELEGILHGTTLNKIQNISGVINRAARQVLEDVDPQETQRQVPLASQLFTNVFNYPCPSDLKGQKIIDIKPQVQRTLRDRLNQNYSQDFDVFKEYTLQPMFNVDFNSSLKTLNIDVPNIIAGTVVNQAESITANGTWFTGGTASNLSVDNINFVAGGGSLQFDLAAGANPSTGFLENFNMTSLDLSTQLDQSTWFIWTYLPIASDFISVKLRWGSSTGAYYHRTVTVTQQNTAFQNGWNLLSFAWDGATVVGVPDPSAINYVRVDWNYDGVAQTAVRLNNIVSSMGTIFNCRYYSKFMFRNSSTGAFQETTTDDSNLINLDTDSFNLMLFKVADFCAQQLYAKDSSFDIAYFGNQYLAALTKYQSMYKSEITKPKSQYYRQPAPSWSRFFGRGFFY